MTKNNSPNTRIDKNFEKDLREIAKIRLEKGLAKMNPRETSPREITKLMRRTQSYQALMKELKTKPRKEDVKI